MNPYTLPDADLERLLNDDSPCGDATTFALGIGARPGRLVMRARYDMTVCASEEALRMGLLRGARADGPVVASGTRLNAGDPILTLHGTAADLHAIWKTAQTLIEYLSGIASCAADIVAEAQRGNPACGVACTRKNFPGTKAAAMKAVLCAGASPHRLSLSETLLVFAEHRAFLPGEAPTDTVRRLRRQWPERPVVVEVSGEVDAASWIEAGADVIQLEKMPVEALARLPDGPGRPRLAAAGGITPANAFAYAQAGADVLATSAPYFAPPRDVAVTLSPA